MALQSTNVSSIRMCFVSGRLNLDVRQSKTWEDTLMREYMAVVERDPETALYVGYVPGFLVPIPKESRLMSSTRI